MPQLSDDCFAFGNRLQTLEAALATIAAGIQPVTEPETVPAWAADGRILANDVHATVDLPPFANAAVDGYAVRLAEIGNPLPVLHRAAAGQPALPLRPGTAMRILTGAPVPQGADTVFMQEDATLDGDRVTFPSGLLFGANIRPSGEDIAAGTLALPAGHRLRPQDLALAAALGLATLSVRRPLRIALFSTGDELIDPPHPLASAQRWDSNRILLATLCRRAGAHVTDLGILPDRRAAIATALDDAAGSHDLLLTSGGVSTGDEDHVRAAVEQAGRLVFWRIAIKPGRPVALGQIGSAILLGLPGNPAAAFVTFLRIAAPVIATLSGSPPPGFPSHQITAGFTHRKKPGRREYLPVRLSPQGHAQLHPVAGAGILTALTAADGLIELPDDLTQVRPGDPVAYAPFTALLSTDR